MTEATSRGTAQQGPFPDTPPHPATVAGAPQASAGCCGGAGSAPSAPDRALLPLLQADGQAPSSGGGGCCGAPPAASSGADAGAVRTGCRPAGSQGGGCAADSRAGRFSNGQAPAQHGGHTDAPPRMGFFTDTSLCIGCKACEVACKEWNAIPEDGLVFTGMSYDHTIGLGADSWRHVAFIEQDKPLAGQIAGGRLDGEAQGMRWLMSSDVCKHCTEAACLDVCPTGSLFRTEFGTVVVQEDICNGCGYCVPACPYGVIDQRKDDGRVWKCTLCYDRLSVGSEPACAKACPTDSIQFGPLDELRERAAARLDQMHGEGVAEARLYGHDPEDGVGGDGAFFLLLDEPEVYGLPPAPVVTTRDLPRMWRLVAVAATALATTVALAFTKADS